MKFSTVSFDLFVSSFSESLPPELTRDTKVTTSDPIADRGRGMIFLTGFDCDTAFSCGWDLSNTTLEMGNTVVSSMHTCSVKSSRSLNNIKRIHKSEIM